MSTALVHIGTHKTGTTAFQQWADGSREALLDRCGIALYEGLYGPSHFEIPLLCLRDDRTMTGRRVVPESLLGEWKDEVRRHLAQQVARPEERLLISSESLSLLRYDDEVAALRDLLGPRQIKVAACLREPASFLESYRHEMAKKGIQPSRFRASHNYVEPDTWLVKWDEMLSVWRRVLGEDRVVDFSYEVAMAQYQSSIPGVLAALSIDDTELPSWEGVTANTRSQPERSLGVRVVRRLNRLRSDATVDSGAPPRASGPFLAGALPPQWFGSGRASGPGGPRVRLA